MKTLQQRKDGVTCSRCHESRWPFMDWTEPYTCQRCQEVLHGSRFVIDPLPSAAQIAQRRAASPFLRGKSPRSGDQTMGVQR